MPTSTRGGGSSPKRVKVVVRSTKGATGISTPIAAKRVFTPGIGPQDPTTTVARVPVRAGQRPVRIRVKPAAPEYAGAAVLRRGLPTLLSPDTSIVVEPQSGTVDGFPTVLPKTRRTRRIDHLISQSFTADGEQAAKIGGQLQAMNLTEQESRYVQRESAVRGDAAIAARERADREDFVHEFLPKVAHAGDVVATGGLVGDIKHGRLGSAGVDAALLLPVLRPLRGVRAALEAGKAASLAAKGEKLAKAGAAAADSFSGGKGLVTPAMKAAGDYVPRTLRHHELVQQLPKARSRITQVGERLVDKASSALQDASVLGKNVHEIPAARIVTAGERVSKAAGRAQRVEQGRARAQVLDHLNELGRLKEGSPEDIAHFWFAQLPPEYRNAEGLRRVQQLQADELEHIRSGSALEDLNRHEAAVKAKLAEARGAAPGGGEAGDEIATGSQALHALRELEEIKVLKTDLPQRAEDIAASVAKLGEVAAHAPAVNEKVLDAMRKLAAERERILTEGGRLNPERAAQRPGLLARALGLEPSGDEIYVGHRLPKPESFRGSNMPSGGTGRVRSPQGVATENRLVLAKTGRLRQSTRVAAEDWHSAQVFRQANVARDDLAAMGEKFEGHVPKGYVLVNPRGRTIPAHWRTDELAQFAGDYEDTEEIRRKASEILQSFIATDREGFEAMKDEALRDGVSWKELRVVPKRLVDRYYAQFRASSGRKTPAKLYDSLVDAVATSIIFGRLGYVPKNVVQNVLMTVPHQGPMLLVNAVRAGQVMADPTLRHLLQAEVGFTGATGALGREAMSKRVTGAVASAVSKVADDPFRMTAFLHEAAAEGVISRVNPLLSEKDRASLLKLLTSKSERARLNDIRSRSVEAMADFSRLTPDQSRIARRILIIPGWLMAGTRYPFHFAATHPIRSALLAYIALGEPGAPDELHFNQPVDAYFHGSGYTQGIELGGKRLRTSSLSPVNTPWDLGIAAVQTAWGKQPYDFTHETAFDYANPALAAGVRIAQGEGVGNSLERLAPDVKLVEGLVHPKASGSYPDDATRLGRFERELGVVPIDVNDPAAKKTAADRERERLAPVRKAFGSVPPEVAQAEHLRTVYTDAVHELTKRNGVDQLSDRELVKVKLAVLAGARPELADAVAQLRTTVDENEDPRVFAAVDRWAQSEIGFELADKFEAEAQKLERARRATNQQPNG